MLLLCTGGSSPSYLLLIFIQESLSGIPQSLEMRSLFNFSGEHSLHSSDVELQLMVVADDIMTHAVICLVYWNK
jgi:hypothetical protein